MNATKFKRKSDQKQAKVLATIQVDDFCKELQGKFFELLQEAMLDEELCKSQKFWSVVNGKWNDWIEEKGNKIKMDRKNFLLFKSYKKATKLSLVQINAELQRQGKLQERGKLNASKKQD